MVCKCSMNSLVDQMSGSPYSNIFTWTM
jgi:hypothetical protein